MCSETWSTVVRSSWGLPGESGDYVCDTPPTKLNWSCENPICPPGAYGYTPNNHMDYYVDSCRTNFTPGQIERMHAALPVLRPGLTDQPAFCLEI